MHELWTFCFIFILFIFTCYLPLMASNARFQIMVSMQSFLFKKIIHCLMSALKEPTAMWVLVQWVCEYTKPRECDADLTNDWKMLLCPVNASLLPAFLSLFHGLVTFRPDSRNAGCTVESSKNMPRPHLSQLNKNFYEWSLHIDVFPKLPR